MQSRRAVIVVDMQNGVFTTPRSDREGCTARINALTQAADMVIFIQHTAEDELREGSDDFALLPELNQPADAFYVTKTACDAFYRTSLETLLREQNIRDFVLCGCATDYCVDATFKNGVSRGYRITVAEDAHTTANRAAAPADVLIRHYNDVWRSFIAPANPPQVLPVSQILAAWQAN